MRFLLALALVACDGADQDDAPAQCQRLVDAICMKAVDCGGDAATCEDSIPDFPASGCATAKRILDRPSFEECLETIPTLACDAATPDTCAGQVVFP